MTKKDVVNARGSRDGADIMIRSAIGSEVLKSTISIPNMYCFWCAKFYACIDFSQ